MPCVVPPWDADAAAADPLAPGHAEAAEALLDPAISAASVATNEKLAAWGAPSST